MLLAARGDTEICSLLVDRGADPNLANQVRLDHGLDDPTFMLVSSNFCFWVDFLLSLIFAKAAETHGSCAV